MPRFRRSPTAVPLPGSDAPPFPLTSDGIPIIVGGPIPAERRVRCTRGFALPISGDGSLLVFTAGRVYDSADPRVGRFPDRFEPA